MAEAVNGELPKSGRHRRLIDLRLVNRKRKFAPFR